MLSSIVIGLGLTDVLQSLHRLFRNHRLVRWDWAVLVATLFAVLTSIQIWWSLFQPNEQLLTIGGFLPQLVELVILYLLAACALPDDVPGGGLDLRAYYDRNGPYFGASTPAPWPGRRCLT